MSRSSMPESGVASPSTLPGRCDRKRAAASCTPPSPRCSTSAAAPSLGEQSIHRCSGSHTTRDASTSSAVTSLRNIAFGLCTPLRRFLTTTSARCSLVSPALAQQPLRAQREVRGRRREPGLFAPRLEERRADDALGHLLDAEHERAVVLAGPDRAGRELQRRAAARASGFDVDDRHAGERQRAEHLVSRRDPAVRGAAERGLERRVPGLGERRPHRVHAHVGRGLALEPPERMDARAGYANAHVTTPSGSSSATRVIGWPNSSRAGSDSRRRVMMRSCSCTSSTTPKPYGTGPVYPGGAAVTAVHAHSVASRDKEHPLTSVAPEYGHVSSNGKWNFGAGRRVAADQRDRAVGVELEQPVVDRSRLRSRRLTRRPSPRARRCRHAEVEQVDSTSSVCSPNRGAPAGATGVSPTWRGTAPAGGSARSPDRRP